LLPADYILSLLRHFDASYIAPTQLAVLKTPKPDTTGMNRSRLRQEARILAALRHPHIVAYVAQTARPTPGVLVQYCVGGSLRDRIRWHQVHGYVLFFALLKPKMPLLPRLTDVIYLTWFLLMVMAYIYSSTIDSIAMSEGMIRRVLCHSLLALHHLHTAHGDRPLIVHRAISPEKRELPSSPISYLERRSGKAARYAR